MRHPRWKKFLSYFKEISLEKTSSLSNPYLEVLLVGGRHQLVTKDAIYSYDDKYENFHQSFKKIKWGLLPGNRVLVLGLGLGSVILLLEKHFNKNFDYTAVEVDSEICRLCNDYTLKRLDSFVEVIPSEAMRFLVSNQESYDMIIMDIFQSAKIPKKFQSVEFLELLQSKLNKDGLLLYNRMNITDDDIDENNQFVVNMKAVFPQMTEIEVKTNLVMINDEAFMR